MAGAGAGAGETKAVAAVGAGTSARPVWVPDRDAPSCNLCRTVFGVFTRRHHCRACGSIFCSNCSNLTITLPLLGYTEAVRTCTNCHAFETRRVKFESSYVVMLQRGDTFKKHANALVGMPRMRLIRLTPDRQFVTWTKEGKGKADDEEERGNIPLADIVEVKDTIKRKLDVGSHGFSLVCRSRTLELETMDRPLRDRWVAALQEALVFVKPTSARSSERKLQVKREVRAEEEEREAEAERRREKDEGKRERERRRTEIRDKYIKKT